MHKFNALKFSFILASTLAIIQNGNAQSNKGLISPSNATINNAANKQKTENQNQENAKNWLIKTIETNFNKDTYEMSDMTTKTYAQYKSDAINIEYDNGLTEESFKKKWKNKFDTKYVGMNGFLIPTQDYGKIKVSSCKLLYISKDKGYVFETIIKDLTFKTSYKRDIKVIQSGKSFLIADVKEY
ncbi:hypothetical protein [Flavobacterium hydatis]|uniref:Uncharacterized protein n=1 Tax=Flavobacterium hydatis TaxID=991 RepID=A0ABX4CEZ1_FLAHY|nr:hypothetical protein [Flavobacterium hydatis]OXA92311.1 hypothetical protein B0A62_15640 [Flavobacterium hydatis]